MARPAEIPIRIRDQATPEARKLATELRGLEREAQKSARAMEQAEKAGQRLADQAIKRVNREFAVMQRESRQTAQAQIQAAHAAKDYGTALTLIERQMSRVSNGSKEMYRLQAQQSKIFRQAQAEIKAATGSVSGFGQALGGLNGLLGVAGITIGFQQITQAIGAAVQRANQLEEVKSVTLALAGSQQRYNEVLQLAQDGQRRYGGTLAENLRGLSQLVNLSNRTGTELSKLDEIARRLAVVDPVQGIEGANLALKEFFNGSGATAGRSLVERFELPRDAIKELTKEGLTAEQKMAGLDAALNKLGITTGVLDARTQGTVGTYTRLQASMSTLADTISTKVEKSLEDAARGAALVAENLNRVFTTGDQLAQFGQRALEVANSYDEYLQKIQLINEQTPIYIGDVQALTQEQFNAAKGAQAQAQAQSEAGTASQTAAEQIAAQRQALADEAAQALISETNSQQLTLAKEILAAQAKAAADSILASGGNIEAEAARLAASSSQVDVLTASFLRLAQAQAIQRAAAGFSQNVYDDAGNVVPGKARQRPVGSDNLAKIRADQEKAIADAQRDQAIATGTNAQHMALLKRELAGLVPGSAAYIRKQTEIEQLQQRINAEATRGAKAATTAANKAARADAAAARAAERDADKLQRAREALMSDEEKLAAKRVQLAGGRLPEDERLALVKEIRDLEERISEEQERRRKAAIDAELAAIDDRKRRREEATDLDRARRVLGSAQASEAQKAAARDVLERIPLEQAKRMQEIADKQREAGRQGVSPGATPVPATAGSTRTTLPVPVTGIGGGRTGGIPVSAAPLASPITLQPVFDVRVTLDGAAIAAVVEVRQREQFQQAVNGGQR